MNTQTKDYILYFEKDSEHFTWIACHYKPQEINLAF